MKNLEFLTFKCIINPPRIKDLTLSMQPLSGQLIHIDCNAADCKSVTFHWFIGEMKQVKKAY